jgi:hypothetical protein
MTARKIEGKSNRKNATTPAKTETAVATMVAASNANATAATGSRAKGVAVATKAAKAAAAKVIAAAPKASNKLAEVARASDGIHMVAAATGQLSLYWRRDRETPEIAKLAIVGGSYVALASAIKEANAHKPEAKLARGAEKEVHSKAAAAASRAANAPAKAAKAEAAPKAAVVKKEERKAEAAKATGKTDFAYKLAAKPDRKDGSWTQHMLLMIHSATTAAKAAENHAKSGEFADKKLHFSWARDKGYIAY